MASRKLLLWFERRRKSKTLNLAQQQITKAIDTVNDLDRALAALYKGERIEVETSIQRLFYQEVEVDNLRRAVFEELTKGELPAKYREDLKALVEHLDIMADHVKDSARSIKILVETTVPREILGEYVEIAKNLTGCAAALGECIEMLGIDPFRARELAQKVNSFEEKVDDGYVKVKILLIKHAEEADAAVLIELMDLANHMEHIADRCADTAEYIRVLAAGEITGR